MANSNRRAFQVATYVTPEVMGLIDVSCFKLDETRSNYVYRLILRDLTERGYLADSRTEEDQRLDAFLAKLGKPTTEAAGS